MKLNVRDIPPPPDEPAAGQVCDGGHCDTPSVGWRYFPHLGEWLPVCKPHMTVFPELVAYDVERFPESEAQ